MTVEDANKLLYLAKANYSYAFKGMSNEEKVMLVQSWAVALQDIPGDIVTLAFLQLLTTSKWLPTVAEIRHQVRSLYYQSISGSNLLYPEHENTKMKLTKEYIAACTMHLRGNEDSYKLSLDRIIQGPYMSNLGSGRIGFDAIDDGQGEYLPEARSEET